MSDANNLDSATIAGRTLSEWMDFARRDDCLERMVPSDLRQLVGAAQRASEARATALEAERDGLLDLATEHLQTRFHAEAREHNAHLAVKEERAIALALEAQLQASNDRANLLAEIIRDCPEARDVWGERIADVAEPVLRSMPAPADGRGDNPAEAVAQRIEHSEPDEGRKDAGSTPASIPPAAMTERLIDAAVYAETASGVYVGPARKELNEARAAIEAALSAPTAAELVRAATALLGNLWQETWLYERSHEENWKAFDKKFPGVRWLRDARDAYVAALTIPSSTAQTGDA